MIVDYVDLSSDDDDDAREEHSVLGTGHSVHVKAGFIDLTSEEDIFEGEHLAHGQGDAARGTSFLKQEFFADDRQAEAAQCTVTLQTQELRADDGQADAAQCTAMLQMQEHIEDDVAVCTTKLPRQKSVSDFFFSNAQENCAGERQKSVSDSTQDDVDCCTTALPDGAQSDVACCTTALQSQESDTAHGKGNAAQPTTLDRREFLVVSDSMQETLQFRNSEDATKSLSRTQEGSHRVTQAPAAEPFPRQFWKAGDYKLATQAAINNGQNCLRIHPKFLHSNATSHKWAFGAIAELLDNSIDEVNNGATFVKIDKMKHSPDGNYSLVIEDNGGGMSPESLRHCMSFGFSHKCTTSSIGRYGNGFKTSTMRLGADAIVFTCTKDNRRLTRSVGLLSYTFLMSTRCNDIYVPAVDYEFDAPSSTFKRIMNCDEKHFSSNLSTLLRWSPFSTEGELLNQFSDMECHGTKIIVFNLWLNDALEMELDFTTDEQDIIISGAPELRVGLNKVEQMHVANRLRYSLRVYASILYLHVPESFQIILCGRAVEPHYAVNDLMYRECIKYQPQVEVTTEVDVITTIGYLKGAPRLDIYGFNVYHKNRLILPYWRAGSSNQRRRGIAGVLEANFIRPTHDKQDFERTGLFQRLETRLKDMATEYWKYHCHLVGYTQIAKRPPPAHYMSTTANNDDHNLVAQATTNTCEYDSRARVSVALHPCALTDQMDSACPSTNINMETTSYISQNAPQQSQTELRKRRKSCSEIFWRAQKRRNTNVYSDVPVNDSGTGEAEEGFRVVLDQNTMLKAECSELEAEVEQLSSKAEELRKELGVWRQVYKSLTNELQFYNCLQGLRRGGHDSSPGIGFI